MEGGERDWVGARSGGRERDWVGARLDGVGGETG